MATRDPMPNRVFRLDSETWDAYADVCAAKGISRSDDLRLYIKREVAAFQRKQRTEASSDS
jgi:hypothetical protein